MDPADNEQNGKSSKRQMPRDPLDEILAQSWSEPKHIEQIPPIGESASVYVAAPVSAPTANSGSGATPTSLTNPVIPPASVFKSNIEPAEVMPDWYRADDTPWMTWILIGINLLVFCGMLTGGFWENLNRPASDTLVAWGADFGPLTLTGQYWRVFTSLFVHIGAVHVGMNMLFLWLLGQTVERLYGWHKFLIIYLLAGIAGNFASLLWNPVLISCGASGAFFGVYGGLLAFYRAHFEHFPPKYLQMSSRVLLIFLAYCLIAGAFNSGTDNAGHIGGLIFGFLVGNSLVPPSPEEKGWQMRDTLATAMMAIVVSGFGFADLHFMKSNPSFVAYVSKKKAEAMTELMHKLKPLLDDQAIMVQRLVALPASKKAAFAQTEMQNTAKRLEELNRISSKESDIDGLRQPLINATKNLLDAQAALIALEDSKDSHFLREYGDRLVAFSKNMKDYNTHKEELIRVHNLVMQ